MRPTDSGNVQKSPRAAMWAEEKVMQQHLVWERWGPKPPPSEQERIRREHQAIAQDYQRLV